MTGAPPSSTDGSGDQSRTKTLAAATDVLWGAAAVTLGTTLVLTFVPKRAAPVDVRAGLGFVTVSHAF
jgi:hypothetical protein